MLFLTLMLCFLNKFFLLVKWMISDVSVIFKLNLSGSDIAVMAMRHLADHHDTIHSLINVNGETFDSNQYRFSFLIHTLRSFCIYYQLLLCLVLVIVHLRRLVCEWLSYRWAHHLGFSGLDDPGLWAHSVGGASRRKPIGGQTDSPETDWEVDSTHELRWRGKGAFTFHYK